MNFQEACPIEVHKLDSCSNWMFCLAVGDYRLIFWWLGWGLNYFIIPFGSIQQPTLTCRLVFELPWTCIEQSSLIHRRSFLDWNKTWYFIPTSNIFLSSLIILHQSIWRSHMLLIPRNHGLLSFLLNYFDVVTDCCARFLHSIAIDQGWKHIQFYQFLVTTYFNNFSY